MKRGPKPKADETRAVARAFGPTSQLTSIGDPPIMPENLTDAAQLVWQEEVGRVMRAGICELDSTFFANYCELEAAMRAAWRSGVPPPAAHLSESRRRAELLGIAGKQSRIGAKLDGPIINANPFARNGHRPQ